MHETLLSMQLNDAKITQTMISDQKHKRLLQGHFREQPKSDDLVRFSPRLKR